MKVYKDMNQLPEFNKAVLTIGSFDGVHVGHSQIISQLLEEAANIGGTPILVTFDPHPKKILQNISKPLYILNTPEEKYNLLHQKGINNIVVVPFTKAFAGQPALQYIKDFLVDKFHPHSIIMGYDHRFGKNREGDYKLLEREAAKYHYLVKEIPEQVLQNVTVSSTKIREALLSGDIDKAKEFLGYPYFFSGKVVEGNKLGRTIGYPTANIELTNNEKLIPANGVYAVKVDVQGIFCKGMMNIGVRPTVDGSKRVIEVNIFDFDKNIYRETLTITLQKRLREEQKFNGLDALKAQLAKDKIAALAIH
ncbi:MAG: bifunctional riboflavin kinase/FAD synthetase [Bacteroidetes bacterium]|nr:bifunctional riboflavin kinase/FAD synthetase [Bacteroidota bacterium]MBS1755989.1 bifunctional riboflavin kinase/FAD synthetase [Bacteroidota bacterium]